MHWQISTRMIADPPPRLCSAFVFTLRYKIAAVFTTSPEVIALVAQMLVLCSVFFPIDGLVLILEGALTGAMQARTRCQLPCCPCNTKSLRVRMVDKLCG